MENNERKNLFFTRKVEHNFFFGLLLAVAVLSFLVFLPFVTPLILASMFAVVLYPLFKKLLVVLRFRSLASLLTVILGIIIVFVPLSFIGLEIVKESKGLYEETVVKGGGYIDNINNSVEKALGGIFPDFSFDLQSYVGAITDFATDNIGTIFSGTVQTVFYLFIFIFALFFFLKDGEDFSESLVKLSPLPDKNDRDIISRLKKSINSVIKGFLLVGLIQGIVAGVGFYLFGVPHAVFWGGITAIAALIPGIGTALITAPAVIFLVATGSLGNALGLAIWGTVAVGLIDNMLGPTLIGRGIKIHPLFILFSVLGGIAFFGPEGFLLGPLVVSLLYVLLEIYKTGLDEEGADGFDVDK